MSSDSKTSFDLEPNPFERSFANKETVSNDSSISGPKDTSTTSSSTSSSFKGNNKHNLHIPNLSTLTHQPATKLPGITPPLFTPSGRRLPPLGLSPGSHLTNPETPGSNLWNSLITATNNNPRNSSANGNQPPNPEGEAEGAAPSYPANQANGFNQFVNTMRKTGLTPNESNLRSGLTPGVMNHSSFPFNSVPGLTTPGALLNSPMTPGLSSLLGMTNTGQNMQITSNNAPQQKPQPANQPPRSEHRGPSNAPQQQEPLPQSMQVPQPHFEQNHIDPPQAPTTETHAAGFAMPQIRESEDTSTSPASSSSKRSGESVPRETKKQKQEPKKRAAAKRDTAKVKEDPETTDSGMVESKSPSGKPSQVDKRKSFLERNRVAASKCRQRKKQLIQKMEDELSFYSTGYRELSAQVSQLRDQLITLKGILVSHKDCSMLAQSVGGFDALNMIIQQANYATQMTASSQNNVTSIPSTIPTTLNNPREPAAAVNSQFQVPPPAPTAPAAPGLPVNMNGQAAPPPQPQQQQQHQQQQQQQRAVQEDLQQPSSTSTTNNSTVSMPHAQINYNGQQGISIPSHHSLTDLPASIDANAHIMENNYASGDLRAIHSMSNLANMNQPHRKQGPMDSGLRPVNSMVDLQSHQFQQNVPQPGVNGLIAQPQE